MVGCIRYPSGLSQLLRVTRLAWQAEDSFWVFISSSFPATLGVADTCPNKQKAPVAMTSFTLGPLSVQIESQPVTIIDSPARGLEDVPGTAHSPASFSSLDGWLGRFGFFEFDGVEKPIGKFYWHKDPVHEPYDRLERAGTISLAVGGGRWVAPLRALKKNDKPYANLHRVSYEELDYLAGSNFRELTSSLGEVEFGRYGDLVPSAGRAVADGLGMAVPARQVGPLVAMIAVTRPMALVKRFGETG